METSSRLREMASGEILEVDAAENQLKQISSIAKVRKAEVISSSEIKSGIYRLTLKKS
ncbi:sulfurtransferase TusA family protein [Maridesulfovibrio bastinii]|uniref:sulfurtransferase TusA family protein n=1 Tax=Maridesulfovibrio bastinii TaxID=47157 RepID=UPI0012ECAE14|nr:hypothetical protein [Maridesulfovibrio bastinii]